MSRGISLFHLCGINTTENFGNYYGFRDFKPPGVINTPEKKEYQNDIN